VHVSTPEAYAAVTPSFPENKILEIIKEPVSEWKKYLKNDFETAIFNKYPVIKNIKDNLYDMGAVYASMSGSGSSIYGLFEDIPDGLKTFDKYFTFVDSF
jgi:4-diphosphocytidyl-2-C-methyl-D-erythritol kinase